MIKYTVNQQVEAIVERILSFGVFVRLEDGASAYIRRRELDLDADVDPNEVVHEGEKISAVVLNANGQEKHIELSRRAVLADPWPRFVKQFLVGDVVYGTVRALHPRGAFIRLQPGIDGFVSLEELAPQTVKKPDEVLWVGDAIEAIITRIDSKNRHISLSIKIRMKQYDQALIALDGLSKKSTRKSRMKTSISKEEINLAADSVLFHKAGPILVVEDNDHVRDSLVTWLNRKVSIVSSAKSIPQALKMKLASYKVFIVDLDLLGDDGLKLIQHLRKKREQAYICIMSSPDMLEARANDIETARVMEVFPKPLDVDEIEKLLLRVASDEHIPFWRTAHQASGVLPPPDSLLSSESKSLDRLQHVLKHMTLLIRAQVGLLFWLDPESQKISILTQTSEGKINPTAIYGLRESPVNDVIVEGRPVFENRVTEKVLSRFDKLINLLSFESCIGVPVPVQGEVQHAVFFFHSDADAFSHYRLRDAQSGALLLSTILLEERIQEHLRSLSPMLLSGELAASFGHDVFNKITALELEGRNLTGNGITNDKTRPKKILDLVIDLKNTVYAFQQMLHIKEQIEIIDVNRVIDRANLLLRDLARKERTKIVLKLSSELPLVAGNSTFLQQVFLNIMLNAIQQMMQKACKFKWEGQRTLEISSSLKNNLLQIRFKDYGPGIHKEHFEKLFLPGFSTREGSGLGLYIARSFLQTLGGALTVEETHVPLGTIFLVELPVMKPEAKHE